MKDVAKLQNDPSGLPGDVDMANDVYAGQFILFSPT